MELQVRSLIHKWFAETCIEWYCMKTAMGTGNSLQISSIDNDHKILSTFPLTARNSSVHNELCELKLYWPSDTIWRNIYGSPLHYIPEGTKASLEQVKSEVQWPTPKGNFTKMFQPPVTKFIVKIIYLNIHSPTWSNRFNAGVFSSLIIKPCRVQIFWEDKSTFFNFCQFFKRKGHSWNTSSLTTRTNLSYVFNSMPADQLL